MINHVFSDLKGGRGGGGQVVVIEDGLVQQLHRRVELDVVDGSLGRVLRTELYTDFTGFADDIIKSKYKVMK